MCGEYDPWRSRQRPFVVGESALPSANPTRDRRGRRARAARSSSMASAARARPAARASASRTTTSRSWPSLHQGPTSRPSTCAAAGSAAAPPGTAHVTELRPGVVARGARAASDAGLSGRRHDATVHDRRRPRASGPPDSDGSSIVPEAKATFRFEDAGGKATKQDSRRAGSSAHRQDYMVARSLADFCKIPKVERRHPVLLARDAVHPLAVCPVGPVGALRCSRRMRGAGRRGQQCGAAALVAGADRERSVRVDSDLHA